MGRILVRHIVYQNVLLRGLRILFLSDLHFRAQRVVHFPWPLLSWRGNREICSEILEINRRIAPDYLLFGGDLATEAAQLPAAFDFLFRLSAKKAKVSVLGNWETSRKPWIAESVWRAEYAKAGFTLLKNERLEIDGVEFYGLDEAKTGVPVYVPKGNSQNARIVLSHSPDTAEMFDFSDAELVLCGHTHGGQIRIPFYGAVATSTKSGKKYEYGQYVLPNGNTPMVVSAGVGTTWFPIRMFCPPEVNFIEFEG